MKQIEFNRVQENVMENVDNEILKVWNMFPDTFYIVRFVVTFHNFKFFVDLLLVKIYSAR